MADLVQMQKKLGKYFYAVSGFVQHDSDNCAPFSLMLVADNLLKYDTQYIKIKMDIIKMLRLKDVHIFNIIVLKRKFNENDFVSIKAEAIANDRDCTPPYEKDSSIT